MPREFGVDTRSQRRQQGAPVVSMRARTPIEQANSSQNRVKNACQCDDSADGPVSGWISAAIMPLEPGPKRTRTYCPGRSSVMPKRRKVSM